MSGYPHLPPGSGYGSTLPGQPYGAPPPPRAAPAPDSSTLRCSVCTVRRPTLRTIRRTLCSREAVQARQASQESRRRRRISGAWSGLRQPVRGFGSVGVPAWHGQQRLHR
ncbi:hypothetical protein ACFX1R_015521 [Malus domestica]